MSISTRSQVLPRPFLKWAGGKTKLIPQYKRYFPKEFKTYYEPFLGGGAVFFHLIQHRPPFQAVLSDINPELINTYRCVKEKVEDLIKLLEEHQVLHSKKYYYQIRAGSYPTDIERAARLIYLNRTCFNGLYRENSKGKFNVPMGRYKNPQICQTDLLRSVSQVLQPVRIEVRKFDKILDDAKTSQDFVYFDPPYYPISSTSYFTAYSRDSFNKDDQVRLKELFAELAKDWVQVMLSNSDCELIRELYSDFKIHPILALRGINSDAKKRGKISEVLVTSY